MSHVIPICPPCSGTNFVPFLPNLPDLSKVFHRNRSGESTAHLRVCSTLFLFLFVIYNVPGQHLTRTEAHQGGPIRSEGSALVNYRKVPSSTQWAFYEAQQLGKQINRISTVPNTSIRPKAIVHQAE